MSLAWCKMVNDSNNIHTIQRIYDQTWEPFSQGSGRSVILHLVAQRHVTIRVLSFDQPRE